MSRRQDLLIKIRMTRSVMQLPQLKLRYKTTEELQQIWRETYRAAKDAGTIK